MTTLLPLAIPVLTLAFVVFLFAGTRSPARIDVTVEEGSLTVRLHGKDVLYAFSRGLTVALSSVQDVAVCDRDTVRPTGPRLPGTGLPGLLLAGSFGRGAERDFWLVRRAATVLVITLKPKGPYRRLVLQVPDPQADYAALRPVLGAGEVEAR